MPSTPKLLLPTTYVSDMIQRINSAKTRICLLSMIIDNDSATSGLVDAIESAALRGVAVEFAADIFTYGELGGFLLPTKSRGAKFRATSRLSRRLTKSGVKFTWLGRSKTTIVTGRTHAKWCVVDNTVYAFGGVNLYDTGIESNDYMFKTNDSVLADILTDEYHKLIIADTKGLAYNSHGINYNGNIILIDGGFIGDSIIYRRACKLASEAESIILVSQYCITGRLGRILRSKNSKKSVFFLKSFFSALKISRKADILNLLTCS